MSTDVYIYVNRKLDGQPRGRYYLGGTGTRQKMQEYFDKSDEVQSGLKVLNIGNPAYTNKFLIDYQDSFYDDSIYQSITSDYLFEPNADDFTYWLVFEY